MYDINFFKKLVFLIFISTKVFALEVVWKEHTPIKKNNKSVSNSIESIQNDIVNQVQDYLKLREVIDVNKSAPPEIDEYTYPEKIDKPQKPKEILLVRGEFESKKAFQERQEQRRLKAQEEYEKKISLYNQKVGERREKIVQQNRRYNTQVEVRNKKLEKIRQIQQLDAVYIKEESLKRQRRLPKVLPYFVANSFSKYWRNPIVHYRHYNYDTQMLHLKIVNEFGSFEKQVSIKVDSKKAKKIKVYPYAVKAKIMYQLNLNQDHNTFSFSLNKNRVELEYDNKVYLASSVEDNQNYRPTTVRITTDNTIPFASTRVPKKQLLQQENYVPFTTPRLSAPTYKIISDNDLLEQLKYIDASPKVRKKWLFVIGIEEYDFTDKVNYSKCSANTFVKVAQKVLGIKKTNSYILVGNRATAGAIEDDLNEMLHQVKKGDRIYFYYSGHGIPVAPSWTPYILPKDKKINHIQENPFFKLKNIYALLSQSRASSVVAIMDSCFSGSTDGKSVFKGVAGSVLVPKKVTFDHQKMVVLTAGRDKQFSNMYPEKGHRLFSYFFMKALLERRSTVRDVFYRLSPQVQVISNSLGDWKRQDPTLDGNGALKF